ncbi:MAG TPA: hypothetical protein VGX16_04700 [Solirubrobacteraceae bacterium]|jgi:hypothetical protein|nr:hypothetical protein [Solirubrobacteraceae bacterium]
MRKPSRILPLLLVAALGGLSLATQADAGHGRPAPGRPSSPASASTSRASHFLTGLGDEQTEMFSDPNWRQLGTRISRYIAPYDAVAHRDSLDKARAWITAAEAQHQQVLVAFYHSEHTPTRLPSVTAYRRDVQRFIALFPHVRQYQAWDESNRGNVPHAFSSPSAAQTAIYYQALKRVCHGCTAIGLDLLDQANIAPSLRYLEEFKREIYRLRTVMPRVWGLHDYSDTNRFEGWRTRELVAAMPGEVWLTETGGIVQFGRSFPNHRGAGLARAARAISYMFRLAASSSHIKRLYIYDWSGGTSSTRFDAGLTDVHHRPRAGYTVVCRYLHAPQCGVRISSR